MRKAQGGRRKETAPRSLLMGALNQIRRLPAGPPAPLRKTMAEGRKEEDLSERSLE